MASQDHRNLFQRGVTSALSDAVDGHFHLSGASHHAVEGVGRSHSEVVVAMSGDDGAVDVIYMLFQVFDFLEILLWQTVARGVRDVHHGGTGLDDGLHDTRQVLVVGASGVLAVEFHVIHIFLGIARGSHGALQDLLARRVELIEDVLIAGADARVDTFVLGILQSLKCHINVAFYGTG